MSVRRRTSSVHTGFTVVEILVVLALTGLVTTMVALLLARLIKAQDESRDFLVRDMALQRLAQEDPVVAEQQQ